MPPNPPSKRVASPRAAWRFAPCKFPHFSRKILNPPRNEILDTPLIGMPQSKDSYSRIKHTGIGSVLFCNEKKKSICVASLQKGPHVAKIKKDFC